jgi:hypothetical protein
MPRRNVNKCPRRGNGKTLDVTDELNLCDGHAFGPWDFHSRDEFATPWRRWGKEITRRWIEGFPGSRPMAAYILGEITPPTWKHKLPGLRHPMRPISGVEVRIADTGWHKTVEELEHLDRLGLVDDDEWQLAIERLECDDSHYHGRYRSMAGPDDACAET